MPKIAGRAGLMPDGTVAGRRLRTREAAEYLGIAKSTLDKMRSKGTGPEFERPTGGRIVVYRIPALDAHLAATRATSTSAPRVGRAARNGNGASITEVARPPAATAKLPTPRRIDELGLGRRCHNALVDHGIIILDELVRLSEDDLMRLPNIGRLSCAEIMAALDALGLRLAASD
jgi:predicted DNA-binding transcriptional regulator AlpA